MSHEQRWFWHGGDETWYEYPLMNLVIAVSIQEKYALHNCSLLICCGKQYLLEYSVRSMSTYLYIS